MSLTEAVPSRFVSPIATPMATDKAKKYALKLANKAVKKKAIRRGVKEVVKAIRKGAKGIVVMAGDVSPVDVLSHVPLLCEESACPYIYVPSRGELGVSCCTKKATCCVMIIPGKLDSEISELYEKCLKHIKALD